MLKLKSDYPSRAEEREILERMTGPSLPRASKVITTQAILRARQAVAEVYVDERIKDYIVSIVTRRRKPAEFKLDIAGLVQYAPPRGRRSSSPRPRRPTPSSRGAATSPPRT